MIKFKENITLTVITEFDEATDNITGEETVTFKADELVDAEVLDFDDSGYVNLQFADGTMATSVQRTSFDVIPDKGYSPFDDPPEYHESFA